ncbi:MAG: hypothetical protein V3V40_06580 [Nitrosomonadaceae bacterium]
MSVKKSHSTMFMRAPTDHGFIQCTIKPEQQTYFEELGFVDSLDKLEGMPDADTAGKEPPKIDPVSLKEIPPVAKKATKKPAL